MSEWFKSSASSAGDNCVEVRFLDGGGVAVRNSKLTEAGLIAFTDDEWSAFLAGVRNGEFDRSFDWDKWRDDRNVAAVGWDVTLAFWRDIRGVAEHVQIRANTAVASAQRTAWFTPGPDARYADDAVFEVRPVEAIRLVREAAAEDRSRS